MKNYPEKKLLIGKLYKKGRNFSGKIVSKHRGGGHKKLYRIIDFKRNKIDIKAVVKTIEYDPNRNVFVSLVMYSDFEKRYILTPSELQIGMIIESGFNVPLRVGNTLPLENIPLGYKVHNLEIKPLSGGKLVRSSGCYGRLVAKFKNYVTVLLPSKEIKLFHKCCKATIGELGNKTKFLEKKKKAGNNCWLGIRPKVRGSAMNAVDHPHGGGKGKSPIGRKTPLTPWGKIALGKKTRSSKKYKKLFFV